MPPNHAFCIADRDRVELVLDAMARRIRATVEGDLALVGIRRRGAPLAQALGRRLEALGRRGVEVGEISLKRYTDDLSVLHEQPRLEASPLPFDVARKTIVLVDDVLYTGRSLLRALAHLAAEGCPRLHTAVLCRRDGAEVPIVADFAGLRLDVGPDHIVEVHVPPYEDDLGVYIRERGVRDP